jgi:hypothetical protein
MNIQSVPTNKDVIVTIVSAAVTMSPVMFPQHFWPLLALAFEGVYFWGQDTYEVDSINANVGSQPTEGTYSIMWTLNHGRMCYFLHPQTLFFFKK